MSTASWPNPRLQRTPSAPLSRQPLGGRKSQGWLGVLLGFSLCAGAGCASYGSAVVKVTDVTGGPIPGISVTAGYETVESDRNGVARFQRLGSGTYVVDADEAGLKSCGPISVRVTGGHETTTVLLMRVGTIADGVTVGGGSSGGYSELQFAACPGHPGTAVTIRTSGPGSVRK